MPRYRMRAPAVEVDAVQWTGDPECLRALPGAFEAFDHRVPLADKSLPVKTAEGVIVAKVGDWIYNNAHGEFWVSDDESFEATYYQIG